MYTVYMKKNDNRGQTSSHPACPLRRALLRQTSSLYSSCASLRSHMYEPPPQPNVASTIDAVIHTARQPHPSFPPPQIFLRRESERKNIPNPHYKQNGTPIKAQRYTYLYCNMTAQQSARHKAQRTHHCEPNWMRDAQ